MPDGASRHPDHLPAAAGAELRADFVTDMSGIAALRPDWDRLAAQDPEATVFLTHDWLAPVLRAHPGRWRVVALRDGSGALVGLLPLARRARWSASEGAFVTELRPGGHLIRSEYVGWLCAPGVEAAVIDASARAVEALPWRDLKMRYEPSQYRLARFGAAFAHDPAYRVDFPEYRINGGTVDNLLCPRVALPDSFESYLSGLSRNSRGKLRRLLRNFEDGTWRVTVSGPETFTRDLGILIDHWRAKWQPLRGARAADRAASYYRAMMRRALDSGTLYLPVLWQGETPLAALGHVVDRPAGRLHFVVAGRNLDAGAPSVGLALHAEAMRWAIAAGLSGYDFGHGDEAYKFSFGAEAARAGYLTLRRSSRVATPGFDPACLSSALRGVARLARAGQVAEAARGAEMLARVAVSGEGAA